MDLNGHIQAPFEDLSLKDLRSENLQKGPRIVLEYKMVLKLKATLITF